MNGGSGDMRRSLFGKLDDQLSEIGFGDLGASLFEGVIETDFLRGHGLAFDDLFPCRIY